MSNKLKEFEASRPKIMKYAVIPTNLNIDIGSVYGPFDTYRKAEDFITEMDFPFPNEVIIRRMFIV